MPVIKQLADGSLAKRRLPDEVSGPTGPAGPDGAAGSGRVHRAAR